LGAVAALAWPAWADSEILPENGSVGHIWIDMRTGERHNLGGSDLRGTIPFWDAERRAGSFSSRPPTQLVLDWGDVATDVPVSQYRFYYSTDANEPVDIDVAFYESEEGRDSFNRTIKRQSRFLGLPGGRDGPGIFSTWIITVTPGTPFTFTGPDLDGDGLTDFGYSFHYRKTLFPERRVGPSIHQPDPNLPQPPLGPAPGIENVFDRFSADPNAAIGPNDFLVPDVNTFYDGTFWFGGTPFAQWRFQLLTEGNVGGGCPSPGCEDADIEPSGGDCDVDLTDLATQLSNFGLASGATRDQGDIEPPGGDGDVDLTDLATMLGAFGTVCD
jgi:hypothetical protein